MKHKQAPSNTVHPAQGFSAFLRLSWLLLIPLLQRAILRPESLWESLQSSLNTFFLFAFVLYCTGLQWRSVRFGVVHEQLFFRRGVWWREERLLPFSQVDCISVTFPLLPSLFGAGLLELETAAATHAPDCAVFLSRRRLQKMLDRFLSEEKERRMRCRLIPLLICVLSWSNAASGLLIAAPFVQKAGQIFGQEFQQLILNNLNPGMRLISVGVPPLAASLAWLLFLGWAAAFLRQVMSCVPFSCGVCGEFAVVRCGLLPRRIRLFRTQKMTALTIRQTLLMRICGVCSLLAHVPGEERQKDCRPLLVAAAPQKEAARWMDELISKTEGVWLRPPKRAVRRCLLPVFVPLMLTALALILLHLLRTPDFIAVLLFPLLILFFWRTLVRFAELPFAGLQIDSHTLRLCRMQGFSLLCTCVDRKNVTALQIRRSWFQRRAGLCTVDVFLRGKRSRRCTVRHLDFAAVCRTMEEFAPEK